MLWAAPRAVSRGLHGSLYSVPGASLTRLFNRTGSSAARSRNPGSPAMSGVWVSLAT